jgi:hypothetical protein
MKIKFIFVDRDRNLHFCPSFPLSVVFLTLDFLLEEISRNHEVSRIKSIGGAAQVRTVSACFTFNAKIFIQDRSSRDSLAARPGLVEINTCA